MFRFPLLSSTYWPSELYCGFSRDLILLWNSRQPHTGEGSLFESCYQTAILINILRLTWDVCCFVSVYLSVLLTITSAWLIVMISAWLVLTPNLRNAWEQHFFYFPIFTFKQVKMILPHHFSYFKRFSKSSLWF